MKFETLKQDTSNGSLMGTFDSTRRKIEEVFGAPTFTTDEEWEKVTIEWVIKFEDGTVASIYDWKRYEEGTPALDEEYEWHIGGKSIRAAELISQAMETSVFDFDISSPNYRKKVAG